MTPDQMAELAARLRDAIAEHPLSPIHGYAADIVALLDRLDKAERERDALSAEAANARQLATAVCNALGVAIMHDAPNAIDLLREDAERYRWLREWPVDAEIYTLPSGPEAPAILVLARGKQLDTAIDAARAAEQSDEV